MRLTVLRNSAVLSLLGLSSAQTTATWAQTQPFEVDVSTESLLSTSQQPLTNIIGTSTPATTELAPVASVTDEFSTTIPTELSTASTGMATSVVTVTSSGASASASASLSESTSESTSESSVSAASSRSVGASASSSRVNSRASSSGTGAAVQSTAAAAPVGVNGQQKMMGVAGALAGAAGVLFV